MSDEMISRTRARTVRLSSQMAAAVLVAGAGLLVVVGVPFMDGGVVEPVSHEWVVEKAADLASEIAASKPTLESDETFPPDFEAIEYALSMVKNAPKAKAEETTPDEPDPVGDPETTREGRTRFLGTVTIGDRMLALVSAGGGQRILGPGQSATLTLTPGDDGEPPEVKVNRVTAEAVLLTEDGVAYRVERAARTGFAVSRGATPEAAGAGRRAESAEDVDAATASADRPLNPDDYRRDDGTIDYESLRKAARARARARQELRQQKNDENGED